VTNCDFANCTAAGGGGAIWSSGTALIKTSKFKHNEASLGGAIYVDRGVASVTWSVFWGNSAKGSNENNIFISSMAHMDSCKNEGLDSELELCIASKEHASNKGGRMSTRTLGIVLGIVFIVGVPGVLVYGAMKRKKGNRSDIHTTIVPAATHLSHHQQTASDNAQCADAEDASVVGYEDYEQPAASIPIVHATRVQ